jgi:hypothetical protein
VKMGIDKVVVVVVVVVDQQKLVNKDVFLVL